MSDKYNFTDKELATPVSKLGLSTRTTNALAGADVETLDDLIYMVSTGRLNDVRNIGARCIDEIHDKLAEMQTENYRNIKSATARLSHRKAEIQSKIDEYKRAIQDLTAEQKFCDQQIEKLQHKQVAR